MDKTCEFCGHTLSEYLETGFLGCPECYNAFGEQIRSDLYSLQGGNLCHTGKPPAVSAEDKRLIEEYRELFEKKEKLGLEGRFAEMSKVNARIHEVLSRMTERGIKP